MLEKKRWGVRLLAGLMLLTPAVLAAGCGAQRSGGTISVVTPNIFGVGEELARQLTANQKRLSGRERLLMTTFVPLDTLNTTTSFGRTLAESLSTQLFRRGFGVVELRKGAAVLMKDPGGELVLTRDAARLAAEQDAEAIVAATYSLTPETVIVNVRLLSAGSNTVLSVAGLEIQRSPAINFLLTDTGGGFRDVELSGYEHPGG